MKKILFILLVLLQTSMEMMAQKQLPPLTYSKQPATLVVQIKHYSEPSDCKNIKLHYFHGLDDEKVDTIALSADGYAKATLDLVCTKVVSIGGLIENEVCFLMTPGKETVLNVDAKLLNSPNPSKPAFTFKGENAEYNKDKANYESEYQAEQLVAGIQGTGLSQFKGKTVQQYKETVMGLYNEGVARLNADKRLGSAFKDYQTTCYQIRIGASLAAASAVVAYANGGKAADYPTPPDFMDEFKAWNPFASNNALYTNFVSDLEGYAQAFGQLAGMEDITVPESYSQIANAINYLKDIDNLKVLTPEQVAKLSSDCPMFEDEVIAKNEALKTMLEENAKNPQFVIRSIPEDLEGEDVFKAIVEPYKGKPTLVDFWATWCGPCKAAMKTIEPVKEALKGKANFIYVTGPSSPKDTWNKMIPTIHGEHYYVTEAQYKTLLDQFESQGIPTYVIVDQLGKPAHKHIGYPGNETMMEELTSKHLGAPRPEVVKE